MKKTLGYTYNHVRGFIAAIIFGILYVVSDKILSPKLIVFRPITLIVIGLMALGCNIFFRKCHNKLTLILFGMLIVDFIHELAPFFAKMWRP